MDEDRIREQVAYLVWRRVTKTAAIMGAVNAILAAVIAFGVTLSEAQTTAIVTLANAALLLGAAFLDPKVPFFGRSSSP